MTILCIDGYNFIHRARAGFNAGDHSVIYNFFRGFRALIEQHEPTRVYFVIEGIPKKRLAMFSEYKANRVVDDDKREEMELFHKQKDFIIDLLQQRFPVSVMQHDDYECDDVIFNLINRSSRAFNWTVVSNDSDFIQLLDGFQNVKLYNPMKKEYVERFECDYVTWKSLRGDGSDNIPGIKGIGDVTAKRIASDPALLEELFADHIKATTFSRNYELIKFHTWSDEIAMNMKCSEPKCNWNDVKESFTKMGFKSIIDEKPWLKFVNTFDSLWAR